MWLALRFFFIKKKTAAPEVRRSEMLLESSTVIATVYFSLFAEAFILGMKILG